MFPVNSDISIQGFSCIVPAPECLEPKHLLSEGISHNEMPSLASNERPLLFDLNEFGLPDGCKHIVKSLEFDACWLWDLPLRLGCLNRHNEIGLSVWSMDYGGWTAGANIVL